MMQDLTKDSPLLQNIKSTLSDINIPTLILAGNVDIKKAIIALIGLVAREHRFLEANLYRLKSVLDHASPNDLASLESTFSIAIGDKENDCFLPYYSQIGEHIPKSPKVITKTYTGQHHFYDISTDKDPRVYNDILEFIKDVHCSVKSNYLTIIQIIRSLYSVNI